MLKFDEESENSKTTCEISKKQNIIIIFLSLLVLALGLSLFFVLKQKNISSNNYKDAQSSIEKLTQENDELKEKLEQNEKELALSKSENKNSDNAQDGVDSEIAKIKKETQACLDKGIAMHNCNYDAINKYDVIIEKNIKKFKNVFTQSQYNDLLNSQKEWEKFIELDNQMLNNTMGSLDGTIHILFTSDYEAGNYETRAIELKSLYETYVYETKGL